MCLIPSVGWSLLVFVSFLIGGGLLGFKSLPGLMWSLFFGGHLLAIGMKRILVAFRNKV